MKCKVCHELIKHGHLRECEFHPDNIELGGMRVIIAGGRDYFFGDYEFELLDTILPVGEVVSGCATGADSEGERWARSRGIPIKKFKADWSKWGNAAGPIRNREMAEYAQSLAIFNGGRGTADMIRQAEREDLRIFDFRTVK